MAVFANISQVINRISGGNSSAPEAVHYSKCNIQAGGVNAMPATGNSARYLTLWNLNGAPSRALAPTSVENPTLATDGALPFTAPSGGRKKYLMGVTYHPTNGNATLTWNQLQFYDRLMHMAGLVGNIDTEQAVNGSVSRYTGAESVGNEIIIEIWVVIGSAQTTVTAKYTNQAGVSDRVTAPSPIGGTGLLERHKSIRLDLQDGDTGVRSVESITLAASTGTAGNIGVVIARRLAVASTTSSNQSYRDFLAGLPDVVEVKDNACIYGINITNSNSTATFATEAMLHFLEK